MTQSELREKINDAVWCSDDRERNDAVESLVREVVEFVISECSENNIHVISKSYDEFMKQLFG